jgi:oxygen-independent coproporphyrinogen-3 oxidase
MAGIYLHIPFCRQACHYCNFHFSTSLQRINDFIEALLKEMQYRKDYLGRESVDTIYFGGGTPSLLEGKALDTILAELRRHFHIAAGAEITLEANPDDIVAKSPLLSWKRAGINRLSIGIQSFFEEDLRWMNRAHSADQALETIRATREAGFENFSIDLIYGSPGLSDEGWQKNIRTAIGLGIPHLSCYALTVEPRTALDHLIKKQKSPDIDPDVQARQFLILMDEAASAGYEHYEISNFAFPGHRSRHNSSYWQGKPYLGLGPSAHSFNGHSRQWNVSNNAEYIDYWLGPDPASMATPPSPDNHSHSGTPPAPPRSPQPEARSSAPPGGYEELTPTQQLNEYVMISLRTLEGCDLSLVSGRFGPPIAARLRARAGRYLQSGKMEETMGRLVLTRPGRLLADGIAADLFFD